MGVKFNALSKQIYKLIRVSIFSSGNASVMVFDRMERTNDTLSFFAGNAGNLTLDLLGSCVEILQVDDHPIMKFAGTITYTNNTIVEICAM